MASYTRDAADLLAVSATLSWRYGCGRPITSGAHQCEDAFEPDAVAARLDFPAIVLPPVERTSEVGRDGGYRNRTAVLVYCFSVGVGRCAIGSGRRRKRNILVPLFAISSAALFTDLPFQTSFCT